MRRFPFKMKKLIVVILLVTFFSYVKNQSIWKMPRRFFPTLLFKVFDFGMWGCIGRSSKQLTWPAKQAAIEFVRCIIQEAVGGRVGKIIDAMTTAIKGCKAGISLYCFFAILKAIWTLIWQGIMLFKDAIFAPFKMAKMLMICLWVALTILLCPVAIFFIEAIQCVMA